VRRDAAALLNRTQQVAALRLLWHHVSGLLSDLLVDSADWLAVWDHCLTWWVGRWSEVVCVGGGGALRRQQHDACPKESRGDVVRPGQRPLAGKDGTAMPVCSQAQQAIRGRPCM
jgi:hypothetical protein